MIRPCRWRTATCLQELVKIRAFCMRSTYFHMESMACHLPMNSGRAENAEAHIQKEQMQLLVKSIENGTITLPKEAEEKVYEEVTKVRPKDEPNEEVSIWPELADRWVKQFW